MPYDRKTKILFIHIPKTGGTSIEHFFDLCHRENFWFDLWDREQHNFIEKYSRFTNSRKICYEPQHHTIDLLKDLIEDYHLYFKFTFVRNPYTRMLSEYCYQNKMNLISASGFNPLHFDLWCREYLSEIDSSHKEPQINYVDDTVDFVGRFENLQSDFKRLLDLIKIHAGKFAGIDRRELPVLNTTGIDKQLLLPNLFNETKKFIYQVYQEDFEQFHYKH